MCFTPIVQGITQRSKSSIGVFDLFEKQPKFYAGLSKASYMFRPFLLHVEIK